MKKSLLALFATLFAFAFALLASAATESGIPTQGITSSAKLGQAPMTGFTVKAPTPAPTLIAAAADNTQAVAKAKVAAKSGKKANKKPKAKVEPKAKDDSKKA